MSPLATVLQKIRKALEDGLAELGTNIPVVTPLDGTGRKEFFVLPATRLFVRASMENQLHEPLTLFRLNVSLTLTVRLDDDATGGLFAEAHESIWETALALCSDDGCEALGGDDFAVDGCQLTGSEEPALDMSDSVGVRTCGFSLALTGRVLNNN